MKLPVGTIIKNEFGYIYKRVEGRVGKYDAFVNIKDGIESKKKTGIHESVNFEIIN